MLVVSNLLAYLKLKKTQPDLRIKMKATSSSQTQHINLTYITILNLPETRHYFCEKELASLSNS